MNFDTKNLTDDSLLDLYKEYLNLTIEEKMLILIRQEKYLNGFQELAKKLSQ
jgi:hypothetical protein